MFDLRCGLHPQNPTFQVLGAKHVSHPELKGVYLDMIEFAGLGWPTRRVYAPVRHSLNGDHVVLQAARQ